MVLGVISPKSRTTSVSIPVAIPTDELPNAFVANMVVSDDAEIFTILFPISIVLMSLLESSVTLRTRPALLLPLSDRDLSEFAHGRECCFSRRKECG